MAKNPLKKLFQKQTLKSFDYQFGNIPDGYGLLSDGFFRKNVADILSKEELCIAKEWFKGKKILDAGCGNGRWLYGFLKLGADVTGIDNSKNALESIKNTFGKDFPNLKLHKENLLELSDKVKNEKYDLVFCWGVAHHTGDTKKALENITSLAKNDGLIYLYLYGKDSYSWQGKLKREIIRTMFLLLPFNTKEKLLKRIVGGGKKLHGYFDAFSPSINDTFKHKTVKKWLEELGFHNITRTIDHTELFIRAYRTHCSAEKYFLPPAQRPYWFQKLA